jgi:hypothetical protein
MADVNIQELPLKSNPAGTDNLPITDGSTTFRTPISNLINNNQINADWNSTSGKSQILNKPSLLVESDINSIQIATFPPAGLGLDTTKTGLPIDAGSYDASTLISKDRQCVLVAGDGRSSGLGTSYFGYHNHSKVIPEGNYQPYKQYLFDYLFRGYQYWAGITNEKRVFVAGYWPYGNGVDATVPNNYATYSMYYSIGASNLVTFGGAAPGTQIASLFVPAYNGQGNYAAAFIKGTDNRLYGFGYDGNGWMANNGNNRPRLGYLGLAGVNYVHGRGLTLLALLNDGTIRGIGYGGRGEMGDGSPAAQNNTWAVVLRQSDSSLLNNIKQIQVEGAWQAQSCYAVTNNGELYTWGYNGYGQLGDNTVANKNKAVLVVSSGVSEVVTGGKNYHSAFYITNDRRYLYACGYNGYGRLGNGNTTSLKVFTQVLDANSVGSTIKKVICIGDGSYSTTFVLFENGRIYGAGYMSGTAVNVINNDNKLGAGIGWRESTPAFDFNTETVIDIGWTGYSNQNIVYALSNKGNLCAMGYNINWKLGIASANQNAWVPYWIQIR